MSDSHNDYNALYVKRQQETLFEYVKKAIDLEIQLSLSVTMIEDYKQKYEESQRQVASQNDIMQQATRSIEDMTNKNINFETHIKNLEAKVQAVSVSKNEIDSQKNNLQNQLNEQIAKANNFEKEYLRQQQEMQSIFDESVGLKRQIEELQGENESLKKNVDKKQINKKQPSTIIDDSTF